jgi:hypothetical protein
MEQAIRKDLVSTGGAIPAFTVTFADGSNYPLPDAGVNV